jgi:hypothetical protein
MCCGGLVVGAREAPGDIDDAVRVEQRADAIVVVSDEPVEGTAAPMAVLPMISSFLVGPRSRPAWRYPRPGFSTDAVQTPARVNVTCVTPLGEEVASTS